MAVEAELTRLRAENARLLRLTPQLAAPPGPAQRAFFEASCHDRARPGAGSRPGERNLLDLDVGLLSPAETRPAAPHGPLTGLAAVTPGARTLPSDARPVHRFRSFSAAIINAGIP